MASIPTSFNPSDYQFLLKSLSEGNYVTKAESLKRFNTLVSTDKKQFSIYAKRVVLAIQDLLLQSRQDNNLLACTLALEIINLNPREIEYYVRTKLLKNLVKNLGDARPQIRKTSHYCLLAYVKTYKSFDEIIPVYTSFGLNSPQWQLRQKSINSFQSILIMEMKFLNWGSGEFRKIFELMMARLKDQSQYVQKASEQCLLSLCKIDEIRNFSKKLQTSSFYTLKEFCQLQKEVGNLQQIKLDIQKPATNYKNSNSAHNNYVETHKTFSNAGQSLLNFQKMKPQQATKQALISRIEQIRRNSQTPKVNHDHQSVSRSLKKVESMGLVPNRKQNPQRQQRREETPKKSQVINESNPTDKIDNQNNRQRALPKVFEAKKSVEERPLQIQSHKSEKIEAVLGRRLIDDLRNDKDWKIRLQAVEQLQARFQMHKDNIELESLSKTFMPVLLKLLTDPNFKVALISLKIIEEILQLPSTNLPALIPQLVDKLSDNKIALRQNISKLIRSQYGRSKQKLWLDNLMGQVKKNPNSAIKEQILTILIRMYEDGVMGEYPYEQVVEIVCPLMDDLKTKIKIKTLDLLVTITMKTEKQDQIKRLVASKMNQVYYEMYCEKIAKQMKSHQHSMVDKTDRNHVQRSSTNTGSRRYAKNSGNTTSTSLQRYSHTEENTNNNRTRNSSYQGISEPNAERDKHLQPLKSLVVSQDRTASEMNPNATTAYSDKKRQQDYEEDALSVSSARQKPILKSFRKKVQRTFDYKSVTTNNSNGETLPPFSQPQKQLKSILTQLKSDDWQIGAEALTKMRRIIEHHSVLLNHPLVRTLVPDIMRLAESLRSSLSKNAVITINQMSNKLRKVLDTDLEIIFNKLIKKTLDANSFISEQVKKALVSVCSNSSQNRICGLLATAHTSRALPIKVVITHIIENIIFLPKFYDKQLDKLVPILVDFMGQGSLQIREKTKAILNSLVMSEKGPLVAKMIPPQHLNKLKKREDAYQSASSLQSPANTMPTELLSNKKTEQVIDNSLRKKKNQKITSFPNEFNQLEGLLQRCESSDWKARSESMTQIYKIIQSYPQETFQFKLSSRIIDVLSQQIGDPNVKVATNALRIFIQVTKLVPQMIEYNLSIITNAIFNCFASNKGDVKALSEQFFGVIVEHVENWMLLQHLCNGCLYGVQKGRPMVIQKLTSIVVEVYKTKPNIFQKNVYSTINKLAQEAKPELNTPLALLMEACYEAVGPDIYVNLKPKAKELLSECIS